MQVRGTVAAPVKLAVTQKVPRKEGAPTPSPVPFLVSTTVTMEPGPTIGPYSIYSASSALGSKDGTKYEVTRGTCSDSFKDAADLGDICEVMDASPLDSEHRYDGVDINPSTVLHRGIAETSSAR